MKQFNVYGIGNALVDIDFEVSVATMDRLKIDKGVMTLIDEAMHYRLLEELDGIKHVKACGGSAANTLFTAQQLGSKTFYSCKVGNDEAGEFFYQELISNGIHTNIFEQERQGITGKCIVLVTPDADRTMTTFLGITSQFSKADLSEAALKKSEFLYIEGYLVASNLGAEAAMIAREMAEHYGVKTAISLSDPNMVTYFKDGLCQIIGNQVDILFCNEREALLFTQTDNLLAAQEVLKTYAKTFIITLGSKGSVVFDGKNFHQIAAFDTPVVDTVGAGDVFAGTFLHALTHETNYKRAGQLASLFASKVVAKFGPRLSQQQVNTLLEQSCEQVVA